MALIHDMANAMRKDNNWDLFCLLEFGKYKARRRYGDVIVFSSGDGKTTKGRNVKYVLAKYDNKKHVIFHDEIYTNLSKKDSEERMCAVFDKYRTKYGVGATDVLLLTAGSPCLKTCTPLIISTANKQVQHGIEWWEIAYINPYDRQAKRGAQGSFERSMRLFKGESEKDVNGTKPPYFVVFQLHKSLIDPGVVRAPSWLKQN